MIGLGGAWIRDGGGAMGAFFNIGPIGAVAGFVAGVLLFIKLRLNPPACIAGRRGAVRRLALCGRDCNS